LHNRGEADIGSAICSKRGNDPQVEIPCSLKKIVGALAVVLWRLAGLNLMLKATTGLANVSGTEFD
jgi:hypothetical protein